MVSTVCAFRPRLGKELGLIVSAMSTLHQMQGVLQQESWEWRERDAGLELPPCLVATSPAFRASEGRS